MFEKIREELSAYVGIDKDAIKTDTSLKEIDADSLMYVELMYKIEDEFDIRLPDEFMDGCETVGDIATKLDALIAAKKA